MYGAVYGDLIGSLYVYKEYIQHNANLMKKVAEEDQLLKATSFYGAETMLVVAVKEASIKGINYSTNLRKYILDNSQELHRSDYFKSYFSHNLVKCARGNMHGASSGNGAIARASSIPETTHSTIQMINDCINATVPTHNSPEGVKASLCLGMFILLANNHCPKEKIKVVLEHYYPYSFDFSLKELRENMLFNHTCEETMPICLYVIFNTNNFEDATRLTLSLGGDTDTNCAIVGAMAEALYGMPQELVAKTQKYLPQKYNKILQYIDKKNEKYC